MNSTTVPPLYSSLAVLDIESFGTRTDPVQQALRRELYAVLENAVGEAGLDWSAIETADTGDGAILRIPPDVPKAAITRALTWNLRAALVRRTLEPTAVEELRLRLALHAGEVARDEFGIVGADLNTACRMVDAAILRGVLKAAARAHLVVAVSAAWYQAVIRHGHDGIDLSSYAPAQLDVKELHETVWVHVPGMATPPGMPPEEPARPAAASKGKSANDGASSDGAVGSGRRRAPAGSQSIHIEGSSVGDVFQGDKYVNRAANGGAS